MARSIMIQGTMSNAGKSILTAGLCRIFKQDGYSVAPFKSQNMSLNSFITADGGEMGRAQVVQAEACGIEPTVEMNPILLKPVTNKGSQIIVHGRARGVITAKEHFATRANLLPEVEKAFDSLAAKHDIIVIEGAGSAAEINLRGDDIVNMGLAKLVNAPVLLAGDIDRGGVFAQLYGTCALLPEDERALIRGLIVNKFRGDVSLFDDGVVQLEQLTGKPVLGVVPYLNIDIDDEDSLSERFTPSRPADGQNGDIAVIRLPKVSNFTDFTALGATDGFSVRYVEHARDLGEPDLLVIPGTRNTIADLRWMRERGLDDSILRHVSRGGFLVGICGGYQMLGKTISDPEGVEGGGTVDGLGLLPVNTVFREEKHQTRVAGTILDSTGAFAAATGAKVEGYEIHMGESQLDEGASPWIRLADGSLDGAWEGNVYGTYLHGVFDSIQARTALLSALGVGSETDPMDYAAYRERQYDLLADGLRAALDLDRIYEIIFESETK